MEGEAYADVNDLESFWRDLTTEEESRAAYLLVLSSDYLRQAALNINRNLDTMLSDGKVLTSTLKQIVMEAVKRAMNTSINQAPVSQMSQTAGPYSESLTFANPAGDIWFKDKELRMLGLKRQGMRSISTATSNIYEVESL